MFKFQTTLLLLLSIVSIDPAHAESQSSCHQIPELVRIPQALAGFKPEVFSPDGHRVILKKNEKRVLFDLLQNSGDSDNVGENPSFSSDGSILSYETSGESSEIIIRDLKNNTIQNIPEKNLCGHKVSEKSGNLTLLTCNGEFKTYDLKSQSPRLLNIHHINNTFTPGSKHFNLDTRASFVLTRTSEDDPSSTLHMIDFERARVYSAPMTPPRFPDLFTYLSNLNAPNTPPELQNIIARFFRNQGGARISPDGQSALIWDSYNSAILIQMGQQKTKSLLSKSDPSTTFTLSPQGTYVFEHKKSLSTLGNEGKIGSKFKINFDSVTFSDDETRIAYTTPDKSKMKIRDIKSRKELNIRLLESTTRNTEDLPRSIEEGSFFFSPDGNQLLIYKITKEQGEIEFYNTKNGKFEKSVLLSRTTDNIKNRAFLEGGRKLLLGDAPYVASGASDIIDLKTGEVETLGIAIPHLPSRVAWPYHGYDDTFWYTRAVCTSPAADSPCLKASRPDEIFQLALQLPKALNTSYDLNRIIKECKTHQKTGAFNQEMAHAIEDRLKSIPKATQNQLTHPEELRSLLLATQSDILAFQPETTVTLLDLAHRSGIFNQDPSLLQNNLIRVFHENKGLYFDLLEKYGSLLKPNLDSLTDSCFSPSSIQSMQKNLVSYLLNSSANPIAFSKVKRLQPISPILKRLKTKELNQSLEALGLAVTQWAQHDFPGIMASTLYYFISPKIRETILGQPLPNYTELSFIRDQGRFSPTILSTHEIDSDSKTSNPHGLYAKILPDPPLPASSKDTHLKPQAETHANYSWNTGGNHYTSRVFLKQTSTQQLFPTRTGPDYKSLWKDQKLTGMILLSSNLGHDSSILGDDYMRYFKDQGFSFEWFNPNIQDVPGFLKEKISSGEIDYLLKDAHSGGVQQDLVSIMSQADLKVGTRRLPDGRLERIYIVVPLNGGTPRTISTSDFGTWVKERESNGAGELVYFNTSCFGGERAGADVAAASTSRLLVIPVHPKQTTTFFVNEPQNATYQLLESIRKEKDFEGFRENLKNVPAYRTRSQNTFLMPDDPDYQTLIVDQLESFPIHARTEIHDQTGREIHFDPLRATGQNEVSK